LEAFNMKRFRFLTGFGLALMAVLLVAASNDRFINGTAIPREKTLVYTTGSQSISAGAVTATSIVNSGNTSIAGTLAVTGASSLVGAATFSAPPKFASAVTGIVGATASNQAGGQPIPLTAALYSVGTVGSSGDSVTLPTGAALGHMVIVENRAASNTMDVFPGASGSINNGAGDVALPVLAGKAYACFSTTAGVSAVKWACVGP
jgi:hypothetical protein